MAKDYQLTQLNANGELDVLHPETNAGNVKETTDKKVMTADERTKLAGIEAGAEVNKVNGIRANGVVVVPDGTKYVNILMPTDVGADLEYNVNTGVLSLLDKDGNVLGSVDLPAEYMISDGYYDDTTRELVLVLSNYILSDPQPTVDTFKTNTYFTYDASTDVYTLATVFTAGETYYNHSEIRIPVGDLIDTYYGDDANITIDSNKVIKFTQAFLTRVSNIEDRLSHLEDGTTPAAKADKLTNARTIAFSGDATGSGSFDGSGNITIPLTLENIFQNPAVFSVVSVDTKGRVVAGNQLIEVGAEGQTVPSASLAVGGLFFKKLPTQQ